LWERVPDAAARAGTDRVALLSRCAQAADAAGDTARAAQLVRQALSLVEEARQPQRAGLLHEQLARCLRALGAPDALDEQQQAVLLIPPETSAERARVLGSLAVYLEMVDRFADAKEAAEEAVAIAGQVGAGAEEASARTALGYALAHLGDPDAGIVELQAARRLAERAGDPASLLRTIGDHADVLLAAGRLLQAAEAALDGTGAALLARLQQAATGPAAAGIPKLDAWHALGRAERTRWDGRPPDPAVWEATAEAWERLGQPYRVAYACFRQAEALLAGGGARDGAATVLRRAADITGRLRSCDRAMNRCFAVRHTGDPTRTQTEDIMSDLSGMTTIGLPAERHRTTAAPLTHPTSRALTSK
jgi:tetratricopeptide (TPR) repeat protein